MLRNYLKIAVAGLTLVVSGCQDTRCLLGETDRQFSDAADYKIKIKAEPYVEHIMSRTIERTLTSYGINGTYAINVTVEKHEAPVAFTEKEVAKEQIRLIAKIELYDSDYTKLAERKLDTFSTYDVCDTLPYADLASRRQANMAVINNLSESVAMAIVSALKDAKQSKNHVSGGV
ncbi:MAG: hypothetical protein LBR78_02685 [Holosporales bacterium]|jgi:hypothetical protein|nr:hypothetical protein [Holosporales bacterium]